MSYFIVPVNDGLLDIDYYYLIEGIQISATQCYVALREGFTVRDTWEEITEEQFNEVKALINEPLEIV